MDTSDSDTEDKTLFSKNKNEEEFTDDDNSNGVDFEEKQGVKIYLDEKTSSTKDNETPEEGEVTEDEDEDEDLPEEGKVTEDEDEDDNALQEGEVPEDEDEDDNALEEGEVPEDEHGDDKDDEDDDERKNKIQLFNDDSLSEKDNETTDNDDTDTSDDSDDTNDYFKIEQELEKNELLDFHPDINQPSNEELLAACKIVRDDRGLVIDELHKTVPFVTKYEFTKVIGLRAKQLNNGADPFIDIEPDIIDGYTIALKEYEQKKIPFIIARPMPNGSKEYWKLSDLEIVHF